MTEPLKMPSNTRPSIVQVLRNATAGLADDATAKSTAEAAEKAHRLSMMSLALNSQRHAMKAWGRADWSAADAACAEMMWQVLLTTSTEPAAIVPDAARGEAHPQVMAAIDAIGAAMAAPKIGEPAP